MDFRIHVTNAVFQNSPQDHAVVCWVSTCGLVGFGAKIADGSRAAVSLVLAPVFQFAAGTPPEAVPQDEEQVTICRRLGNEDLELDWNRTAVELERQVRAFHPRPLARTRWLREEPLEMKVVGAASKPRTICSPAAG